MASGKKQNRDEIDTTASTEVLRKHAQKFRDRIDELEPQLDALKALVTPLDDQAMTLLEEIAATLREATEVSNPIQAATLNPSGVRTDTTSDPGRSTRAPRRYANEFRVALISALHAFSAAKQRNWAPPEDQAPKVRCWRRDCPAYGINVPAWREYRSKRIYAERCQSCGEPLKTDTPSEAMITE